MQRERSAPHTINHQPLHQSPTVQTARHRRERATVQQAQQLSHITPDRQRWVQPMKPAKNAAQTGHCVVIRGQLDRLMLHWMAAEFVIHQRCKIG